MAKVGTSTKVFYLATCDCGQEIEIERNPPPDPNASPLAIVDCVACGEAFPVRLPREDGKRSRKMQDDTFRKQIAILNLYREMDPPLTVRQVFYALSVRGVVPKDEKGYRQAQYQLKEMRLEGTLPYGYIADNTRWQIKPPSFNGLKAALERTRAAYRRDLWANQPECVEIWCEKDALAGVMRKVTEEFDVPLFVARGYSSMTFAYDAAEEIKARGKPTHVYHFGDFDPSGVDAARDIRDALARHGAKFHFERVAITEAQIAAYNLPTRETKKKDPRAKSWGAGDSVELDALPPDVLRQLVQDCILNHMDPWTYERLREIEEHERQTLAGLLGGFVR